MRGISETVLALSRSVTASGDGGAVNVGEYAGIAHLVLNASATDAGTATIKLQHSDDGTTGWEDVTGAAFAPVGTSPSTQSLSLNADKLRKFARVVDTLTGATAVVRGVMLVGQKQSR